MSLISALNFLPAISENQKIDVKIEGENILLKLSTFTEGIGWTCQKTMCLDSCLLDDLHRSIAAARYRIKSAQAGGKATETSNVIDFPKVA